MKIYQLTNVGNNLASSISHRQTPALRVLYFLKRRGGRGTDDQITDYITGDSRETGRIIGKLKSAKAVQEV